jgi:hypothetical protein
VAKKERKGLPLVDMNDPKVRRMAVQNIHSFFNTLPSHVVERGRQWYPAVNEAVHKGVRGTSLSPLAGAGLVAAVSPNMDWENHNIAALKELSSLKDSDYKAIAAGDRSSVAGMSISRAPKSGLVKAHRILQGEDVDEVLRRGSAPKTNAFAHNINLEDHFVTVDGRAHDIAANRMQGWTQGRGIQSAALKTGKPTRYEHFEDAYRGATAAINAEHGLNLKPFEVQAATWEGGRAYETSFPTKSGKPRVKGVTRRGQSYV